MNQESEMEQVDLPDKINGEEILDQAEKQGILTPEERKEYGQKYKDFADYIFCVMESLKDGVHSAMTTNDKKMIEDAQKLHDRFGVAIAKVTVEKHVVPSYIG